MKRWFLFLIPSLLHLLPINAADELPLFYWNENEHLYVNFGDYISLKLVEKILDRPIRVHKKSRTNREKKFLASGSIISFAFDNDVIWGSGINGKLLSSHQYNFANLDVRAVRGPLTRQFLMEAFDIEVPEVYGDPALLIPYFFPEYKKKEDPSYEYTLIPHYSEEKFFPRESDPHIIYSTEPWNLVLERILDSKFVISTSLHGIIVAEAYGIPARLLRITEKEPIFKFQDYYLGTQRPYFQYATTLEEALKMGGEPPFQCDLYKLYQAFPFEFWNDVAIKEL